MRHMRHTDCSFAKLKLAEVASTDRSTRFSFAAAVFLTARSLGSEKRSQSDCAGQRLADGCTLAQGRTFER